MTKKASFWFFLLAAVTNLTGKLIELPDLANYSKILLMPFLLYYIYESAKGAVTREILLLGAAIIFSWIGDILLIKDEYFLFGVGAFFFAQITYIILFRSTNAGNNLKFNWIKALPFLLYGVGFFYLILPSSGNLMIPIILYGLALLSMGIAAVSRTKKYSTNSYLLILTGSCLFIISDSLIAIGMFLQDFLYRDFLIMLTYVSAQFMISTGILQYNAEMMNQSE